jgi:hypothetical protein
LALAYGLALLSVFRGDCRATCAFFAVLPFMAVVFLGARAGLVLLLLSL